jgi:hypothetical protein
MQQKYHLIAAPAVFIVLMSVYVIGSKISAKHQAEAIAAVSAQSSTAEVLNITQATWGRNCNTILESIQTNDTSYTPIEVNNVLDKVKTTCDGKQKCSFSVGKDALGESPISKDLECIKTLDINFRCNKMDFPLNISSQDGEDVVLDCNNKPKPSSQPEQPTETEGN